MKLKLFITYILFSLVFLGCKNDDGDSTDKNKTENKTETDKENKTETGSEKIKISAEDVTSFNIKVAKSPITLDQIASGAYTKPDSRYGMQTYIDFAINDDNTIYVFWQDKSGNRSLAKVSLETKKIIEEINIPAVANNKGRFLGFEKIGEEEFILGYSKDNSNGDKDAEAWYTAFTKSKVLYSTRIWGDKPLKEINSKGEPNQAGSSVIRYNKANDVVIIYLSHRMMYSDNIRHQGGWVGFLNAETGELLKKNEKIIGDSWYFSHNFDQRAILSSDNKFYTLAHGDAYPRALGIAKWNHTSGKESDLEYYKITNGKTGDNTTQTHTGDLAELKNNNIAITYSTKDGRKDRDLRLAIISGFKDNKPQVKSETWITENESSNFVGWGIKVAQYKSDKIVVGWNQYKRSNKIEIKGSNLILLDYNGKVVSDTYSLKGNYFYPNQSIKLTSDGKNLVFVTSENGELKVFMIKNN